MDFQLPEFPGGNAQEHHDDQAEAQQGNRPGSRPRGHGEDGFLDRYRAEGFQVEDHADFFHYRGQQEIDIFQAQHDSAGDNRILEKHSEEKKNRSITQAGKQGNAQVAGQVGFPGSHEYKLFNMPGTRSPE